MNFLTSPWLWAPLTALLPLVVLMYLLKLKRRRVVVPSTLLWRRAVQDLVANAPFQKLRNNILLWLQLLALAALIIAFARPLFELAGLGRTTMILLVDHSASMQVKEPGGRTRLDLAKAAARQAVDSMTNRDEAILIQFSDHTDIVQTLTSDKGALRAALERIKGDDVGTNLKEAALILEGLTTTVGAEGVRKQREDTRTVLVSDGRSDSVNALANVPNLEYVKVGEETENLGIASLDIRESFSGTFQHQVFASIANSGDESREALVELQVGENVVDVKKVVVPGSGAAGVVFNADEGVQGLATVRIDAEDAFALDNVARGLIAPPTDISVLVVSKGNFFLEQSLNVDPRVHVSRVLPTEYQPTDEAQIVVFDDCKVAEIPNGNFLFVNCLPPAMGFSAGAEPVENPRIIDWNRTHPLTRFANFEKVLIGKAMKLTAPRQALPILEAAETPLISYLDADARRVLVVGFDIFKSYWPVDVSFPIFMANVIDFYARSGGAGARPVYQTGATIALYPDKESSSATVTRPSGEKVEISFKGATTGYLTQTGEAGVYRAKFSSGREEMLPLNLLSESESRIAPVADLEIAGRKVKGTGQPAKVNREIWHWLALGALGVLLIEWLIYCRRAWL